MHRLLKPSGGLGIKSKNRMWNSFRVEIILYTLLSMFFSLLTVLLLYGAVYVAGRVSAETQKEKYINQEAPGSMKQPGNAGNAGNAQNTQNFKESLPNSPQNPASEEVKDRVYYREKRGSFQFMTATALILAVAFFILYFLLLTRKFTIYLNEITEGIREISSGNFDVEISVKHEDELTMIAEGLNKMAADVKLMMENERNSESSKNELITNVAHDLRTPLTSIIGYLGLVLEKDKLDGKTRDDYIGIAYDKSKRLEKLIEDLFAFTKVSFGQITLRKSNVDIVKLAEQLMEEFYPSIQDAGLECVFRTDEKSVILYMDADLMARALANLLSNAVKYGRDGKLLRMEVKTSADCVRFLVINYGKIIPDRDLEHIFDKFYRVEASRSDETGGTGLGLAIARNIVRMHEGFIRVKSDQEGTVFTVTLFKDSMQAVNDAAMK